MEKENSKKLTAQLTSKQTFAEHLACHYKQLTFADSRGHSLCAEPSSFGTVSTQRVLRTACRCRG